MVSVYIRSYFFCKSKKNDNFVTSLDSPDSESAKDGVL